MVNMNKLSVRDVDLKDKRVLIRVDYNVPMLDGVITDKRRIAATIPTLMFVIEQKPKSVILMSHFGRPDGKKNAKYSLKPVADALNNEFKIPTIFLDDCVGEVVKNKCLAAPIGSIILLENLRFHPEEEGKYKNENGESVKCDKQSIDEFRMKLTELGDIFINDAFGTVHRAHSSIVGINSSHKISGLLLEKELLYFAKVLVTPQKPVLAILGGAKVKDKIKLIKNLLSKVDEMIIGGGMAYTFLKVLYDTKIGNSLYDQEGAAIVQEIVDEAKSKNVKLHLPVDVVVSDEFSDKGNIKIVNIQDGIPNGYEGLDCGPLTIKKSEEVILRAKTIIWNGPQGVFEIEKFAQGSMQFLDAVIEATKKGAISIVGGGDTASLVENFGKANLVSHVSTGGGASLELLEGKILPGIAFLDDK